MYGTVTQFETRSRRAETRARFRREAASRASERRYGSLDALPRFRGRRLVTAKVT